MALCDAGIVLRMPTSCGPLRRRCRTGSGLVLALKAAEAPENFAAELERAYIDGHQARFLFAADRLGIAVASGGVTLMSNDTLQRIGNWRGFNRWIADDYSVTRSVRELGLRTRLGDGDAAAAAGPARLAEVWSRQVRWARTRLRLPVWPLVLWEPAIGWAVAEQPARRRLWPRRRAADLLLGLVIHTVCGSPLKRGSWPDAACHSGRARRLQRWCARRWRRS